MKVFRAEKVLNSGWSEYLAFGGVRGEKYRGMTSDFGGRSSAVPVSCKKSSNCQFFFFFFPSQWGVPRPSPSVPSEFEKVTCPTLEDCGPGVVLV